MSQTINIHWFRHDLRLQDNPALTQAAKRGALLCIYIHQKHFTPYESPGAARCWWTHHSLICLNQSLDNHLALYEGDPVDVFTDLAKRFTIESVHFTESVGQHQRTTDATVQKLLQDNNIECHISSGATLWPLGKVLKDNGTPYAVFTPFFRRGCLKAPPPRLPLSKPKLNLTSDSRSLSFENLTLLPKHPWTHKLIPHWQIGEAAALKCLKSFISTGLKGYKDGRNFPALSHVSRLSPHLQCGEISPNTVWYAIKEASNSDDSEHYLSELGWREFSYQLLYHHPKLSHQNLQKKFDAFPWDKNPHLLKAWQKGQTGIPIVDAGMRELWQTGYMHNRVRMIVASFLVKNCLLDWRLGERWFWDCLVDADIANNSASWQWVAGCGADAAPYFRIFNPVTQGQKFDAQGDYTRKYIPELKDCPLKYLFNPWEAPPALLKSSGITLGQTYPMPVVALKRSREKALAAFASIKGQ